MILHLLANDLTLESTVLQDSNDQRIWIKLYVIVDGVTEFGICSDQLVNNVTRFHQTIHFNCPEEKLDQKYSSNKLDLKIYAAYSPSDEIYR
jgi:hypothetical protein